MQLLDGIVLKDKYDVVIVGAGLGGITAGALLAKKGLDVLVVEQHYIPGGVCSTVKRQGTCMDAGAALMFGWDADPNSPHPFVMNTLEEDIDMILHESIYTMNFGEGKKVTFWRDFEKYFKELNAAFPGKEKQFRGFYEHCFKVFDSMNKVIMPMSPDTIPRSLGLKMFLKHPFVTMKLPKSMNTSMKSVLDKYVQDPFVEGFFDLLIASCYCTTVEETPLMLASAVAAGTHSSGAAYPVGSPQILANKLEKGLEKFGGQILYRNLVEEIIISNNKAQGIRLQNGTIINADRVISNSTVWQLYNKLIKPEHLKPGRLEWANNFKPTFSAAVIYMSVKEEAIPKGVNHIEAFIGDLRDLSANNYFVYMPSIEDPSICPDGVHSVSVLCSDGDYEWPRPWEPGYNTDEYLKEKEKIAEKALDVIQANFPNFRENIITLDVATPTTIERFTLKDWGNIGGPKQALGQHLFKRLPARSEINNLYCVGDSTAMGEGIVSVTASAVGAANMILQDLKMKEFLPTKFDRNHVHFVKGKPRDPMPAKDEPLTESSAKRLAIECQWCEDPKCMTKCPAGIDVLNFVRRIEVGNYLGAARSMREVNPLAEICGVACPAENLCESECTRIDYSDGPVRIKDLQAWVCKQAGAEGWDKTYKESNGSNVAIVGAGPSGLSCAYYLAKVGYSVDVFEKESKAGGIPSQAIPKFRLSDDVFDREIGELLKNPNITMNYNKEIGKDLELTELTENYDAVYLATGLNAGRLLQTEGIDTVNAVDALSFLKSYNNGQLTSIEDNVLVIGGGSVATDAAMVASKLGAKTVSVVCLETEEDMPCLTSELQELRDKGIQVVNAYGPQTFGADSEQHITCVSCTSVFDKDGNFCPEFDESKTKKITFEKVIIAIGQQIESEFETYLQKAIGGVKVNDDSFLVTGQTKIYAGGDLIRGAGTIVQAVADGRQVAQKIHKTLS